MLTPITTDIALATLERSTLPTVLTEGSDDYRIMRKIEQSLADMGIDFLPVGNKDSALSVWSRLSPDRRKSVMAIVDLDLWLFKGIPIQYQDEGILYTLGYSIENDIFVDGNLLYLCNKNELENFKSELSIIASWYARQVVGFLNGDQFCLSTHVNEVLAAGDISASLSKIERDLRDIVERNYSQTLRGKNLLQLLARQLSKPGRYAKFGYKQLYEVGSMNLGDILRSLEFRIRAYMS